MKTIESRDKQFITARILNSAFSVRMKILNNWLVLSDKQAIKILLVGLKKT